MKKNISLSFGALLMLMSLADLALAQGQGQEPTNAEEAKAKAIAAEKKAAHEALVAERYKVWLATLSPERQAWEKVLQDNLGSFYLPAHQQDKISRKSNAWDYVEDDSKLPRVLIIGDSVSRGYTLAARNYLAGKANVHRAPENCGGVSRGMSKIEVWLGDGKWDVIHFNFGIHDRATGITDYTNKLEKLILRMQKTGAKLIWASTTPIPDDPAQNQTAASVVERNKAAAELMKKYNIPIDDLFTAVTPHLNEFQPPNNVHFKEPGYDFMGKLVGAAIEKVLQEKLQPAPAPAPKDASGE